MNVFKGKLIYKSFQLLHLPVYKFCLAQHAKPLIPVDTGRKLNVLCTFSLLSVSTGMLNLYKQRGKKNNVKIIPS